MKKQICLNCGEEMIEVWDSIAKRFTGHLWRCSCMSDDVAVSVG